MKTLYPNCKRYIRKKNVISEIMFFSEKPYVVDVIWGYVIVLGRKPSWKWKENSKLTKVDISTITCFLIGKQYIAFDAKNMFSLFFISSHFPYIFRKGFPQVAPNASLFAPIPASFSFEEKSFHKIFKITKCQKKMSNLESVRTNEKEKYFEKNTFLARKMFFSHCSWKVHARKIFFSHLIQMSS